MKKKKKKKEAADAAKAKEQRAAAQAQAEQIEIPLPDTEVSLFCLSFTYLSEFILSATDNPLSNAEVPLFLSLISVLDAPSLLPMALLYSFKSRT